MNKALTFKICQKYVTQVHLLQEILLLFPYLTCWTQGNKTSFIKSNLDRISVEITVLSLSKYIQTSVGFVFVFFFPECNNNMQDGLAFHLNFWIAVQFLQWNSPKILRYDIELIT